MINNKFRVDILGDLDYEDLIADIYFNDKIVATITQEMGPQNMDIQLHPPENQAFWNFKINEFEEVVQYAKNRLLQLRKVSEK